MYQSSSSWSFASLVSGEEGLGLEGPALEAKMARRDMREEELDAAIHELLKE